MVETLVAYVLIFLKSMDHTLFEMTGVINPRVMLPEQEKK